MRPPHPHPLAPAKKVFVVKDRESEVSFIIKQSQNEIILKFQTYHEKFPKIFNKEILN
jgi:hypothetical protein